MLNLVPKSRDPQKDRLAADPMQEKKLLEDDWKKKGEQGRARPRRLASRCRMGTTQAEGLPHRVALINGGRRYVAFR